MLLVLTTHQALDDGRLRDRTAGWVTTITITAMAFALRIWNVGFPNKILFDETYYAKEAWGILQSGYERKWTDGKESNPQIAQGDLSGFLEDPAYVVHPPLGKQLIAVGESMFGMNGFGWRFASVIFGTLLVFFTIRLARRLSRSTLVGAIAGILLTFDGLAFVMSRLALLDIFQATFTVAAVSAIVADRDWFRHKLADHLRKHNLNDLGGSFGPVMLWRPWRILAGLLLGAAVAVKWNSLFVIAVFGLTVVAWDLGARRLAGAGSKSWWSILADGVPAFVQLVVLAVPVYMASWLGWITTSGGYYRDWGQNNPEEPLVRFFGEAWGSLIYYHQKMYGFHTGNQMMVEAEHPYEAHPAGWLFMIRPIGIEAVNDIQPGEEGCDAVGTTCLQVISGLGTPTLWWAAAIAIGAAVVWWLIGRDWRFSVPLLAIASTWIPWFRYADRPLFFFYAIMIIPFSSIILAMALGKILGPADHPKRRKRAMIVGIIIALIIATFAFFYPVYTAETMSRPAWLMRMWLGNLWI